MINEAEMNDLIRGLRKLVDDSLAASNILEPTDALRALSITYQMVKQAVKDAEIASVVEEFLGDVFRDDGIE